jgi:cysteine-rich repeat protein
MRLFFQLDDATDMRLWIYQNPPGNLCDPTLMEQAGPWDPPGTPFGDPRTVNYGRNEMTLDPGEWGFVFRAGNESHPIPTRDLARGCATARLRSGASNPPVNLQVVRPFWPGMCGDGTLDPEEMCDDGGTADDDVCSADCQNIPVRMLSTLDAAVTANGAQYQPDVTPRSGGYALVYTCDTLLGWEESKSVNAQQLDEHGGNMMIAGSWPVVKLNTASIFQSQEQVRASVNSSSLVAVWLDFFTASTVNGDVVVRPLNLDTAAGPAEALMYSDTSGTETEPVIAGNGGSTMIAAWVRDEDVMCRRVVDGSPESAAASPCSSSSAGVQGRPAAAMAPDGSYAVAWSGGGAVQVRFFSAAGAATGAETAAATSAGTHSDPALAYDPDGRLLVVWKEGGNVRGRIFAAGGTPDASDFVIGNGVTGSGDRGILDVAGGAGRDGAATFLVVWVAPGVGVRGRLVTGTDAFGINRVNPPASSGGPYESRDQFPVTPGSYGGLSTVSVASTGSGSALVAWEDTSSGTTDIRGRIIPMN